MKRPFGLFVFIEEERKRGYIYKNETPKKRTEDGRLMGKWKGENQSRKFNFVYKNIFYFFQKTFG